MSSINNTAISFIERNCVNDKETDTHIILLNYDETDSIVYLNTIIKKK